MLDKEEVRMEVSNRSRSSGLSVVLNRKFLEFIIWIVFVWYFSFTNSISVCTFLDFLGLFFCYNFYCLTKLNFFFVFLFLKVVTFYVGNYKFWITNLQFTVQTVSTSPLRSSVQSPLMGIKSSVSIPLSGPPQFSVSPFFFSRLNIDHP